MDSGTGQRARARQFTMVSPWIACASGAFHLARLGPPSPWSNVRPGRRGRRRAPPAGLSFDDTLGDQLRAALGERASQATGPAQYGAWVRKPS